MRRRRRGRRRKIRGRRRKRRGRRRTLVYYLHGCDLPVPAALQPTEFSYVYVRTFTALISLWCQIQQL